MEKREPGTELLSQGATPQVSSPLQRFTIEFGMGRSGSIALVAPGKTVGLLETLKTAQKKQKNCIFHQVKLSFYLTGQALGLLARLGYKHYCSST